MGWVSSLSMKTLQNIQTDRKYIYRGRNRFASHFKPINIVRLVDETHGDQEEGERIRKII
jgi:hypothetical protein